MEQTNNQVKSYDGLDVAEGFSLAYEQAQDQLVMIKAIQLTYVEEKRLLTIADDNSNFALQDVERLLNITKIMLKDQITDSKSQQDFYQNQA